jgi:hypothetical protein
MKNKFVILVFSYIVIGYSSLPAKTPKKFTDIVILKNGTVLSGVKATESILVTTEDGVTTIYKKKDISEVQRGGISRDSNLEPESVKKENKQDVEEVKKEKSLAAGRWSDYQGAMRWEDAIAFCLGLGMRLPTIAELRGAFVDGTTESWKKDGLFYWSSTPGEKYYSYNIGIMNGHYFSDDRTFVNDVRCIR